MSAKLRVISGTAKNTKLTVPKKGTKPMTDRAKSALFSMIQEVVPGSVVLDLYAGSGAVGIEALSRGAKHATFVDISKDAVKCIKENLRATNFTNKAIVIRSDTKRFLKKFDSYNLTPNTYNLTFICPPHKAVSLYDLELVQDILKKHALVVLEHPKEFEIESSSSSSGFKAPALNLPVRIGNLEKIETRNYGKTSLTFFAHKAETEGM